MIISLDWLHDRYIRIDLPALQGSATSGTGAGPVEGGGRGWPPGDDEGDGGCCPPGETPCKVPGVMLHSRVSNCMSIMVVQGGILCTPRLLEPARCGPVVRALLEPWFQWLMYV